VIQTRCGVILEQNIGKVFKNAQEISLHFCCHDCGDHVCGERELCQVDFVLVDLLVIQGSLLKHAAAEL